MRLHRQVYKADYKCILNASRVAAELDMGQARRVREQFFVSMARRAIVGVLGVRCDSNALREIEPFISHGVSLPSDESADMLSVQMLKEPTALGWAYQVWNSYSRDSSSWAISRKDESRHESVDVASVTQVFTDRYIADFLVSRCMQLWQETTVGQHLCPSVCDPAVGTGHLLVSAVAECVARGVVINDLAWNIYGYDIDPLVIVLARAAVLCEIVRRGFSGDLVALSRHLKSSIRALDPTYGALDRQALLNDRTSFDIILANPPYLGRRKLPSAFRQFLDDEYPAASIDLCAAFLQRCIELLSANGQIGVVTSDKWIRLKQYAQLRIGNGAFKGLYGELTIDGIYELGERAFSADVELHDGMRACLLIGRKSEACRDHRVTYVCLSQVKGQIAKQRELAICHDSSKESRYVSLVQQSELVSGGDIFLKISGLPERFSLLSHKVVDCCDVVVGVQTSDDAEFVRYIWQVPEDRNGWRVHCKGGGYARWGGLARWAINWGAGADGFLGSVVAQERAENWSQEDGWVYSWFANGNLGVRRKRAGWSFGRAAAGGIFPRDRRLIAFLNSRIASAAVRSIGGKIQLPEGVVKSIPVPSNLEPIDDQLITLVVDLRERLAAAELTEASFRSGEMPELQEVYALEALVLVIEGHLEAQVERGLNLSISEREALVNRIGGVAGWYAPSRSVDEYDTNKLLPDDYRDLRGRHTAMPEMIAAHVSPPSVAVSLEALICSAQVFSSADARWMFPSSGLVELVCRALSMHPYDALKVIFDLANQSRPVAQKIYGQHLAKCLVEEVLNHLGFRWWNSSRSSMPTPQSMLSFDDVVSLAEDKFKNRSWQDICDVPIATWVRGVFDQWHQRYFFGESPLRVTSDKQRIETVELRWK